MASAEELLGLIEVQSDRRHRISRIVENVRKSNQLKTLSGVQARLHVLESYWSQFVEDHRHIRASRHKEIRDSDYLRRDIFGDTEELYLAQDIELRTIRDALSAPGTGGARETVHAVPTQASVPEAKLPRIPIPTFDGAFDEWRTFRDLFLALVGENKTLANVHKMHYLKQHVQGEPERFLRHHPITDAGYQDAWAALFERYDNEQLLVEQYLYAFFALPPMKRESAAELRRVFDRTCEVRTSLHQLGRPTDQWDDIWVYRTVTALDAVTRRDWERATNKIRQPVRWSTLADFLKAKLRELKTIEGKSRTAGGAVGDARLQEPQRKARTHTVQASGRKGRCAQCSKPHPLWDCTAFRGLTTVERRRCVADWRRCFNCLSNGVISARPPDATTAVRTTTRYCTPRTSPEREPTAAVSAMQAISRRPAGRALLATARVQLLGEDGRTLTVRALIDPGSEVNLIAENAVQHLRALRRPAHVRLTGATDSRGQRVRAVASLRMRATAGPPFQRGLEALIMPRLTTYRPIVAELPAEWSHLAGATAPEQEDHRAHCHTLRCEIEPLHDQLRRFWELEELPSTPTLSPDEED
ncbi:uncharacterized protein LOC116853639 [Odontomachus brunneus]|uniref:uncharacterized protein LOC116853639 n=1 Tax=Odontomachus brunneus TaxID=486640 RepID=UPI0013F1B28D|nr:uncharacterized protein LOC116853639 [Odontomachus brunneus]